MMAFPYVKVIFEIGHKASVRNKRTPEGFTHDWELFVRGADNTDIHFFVDKVVFHLHETFPNPKRVVKEPPYVLKESGYAGFPLPIDIRVYVKNKDKPRKIRFNYELVLQERGLPPMSKVTRETYVFCPSGDFRRKLIKGGGTGVLSHDGTEAKNSTLSSVISKRKLITNTNRLKSPPPKRNKKDNNIKLESKFATLFGSPIQHSELPLTISKSTSQKLSSSDKAQVKIKSSPHHKEDKKDKDKERDKEKRKIKQLSIEEGKNSTSSYVVSKRKLITNTNRLKSPPPKRNKKHNNIKLESKFATLFGSPIQHSELPLTISKSTSQKLSSSDKAQVKIKSSPHHKEDKKDKDKERDKEKRKIKQLSIEEGKNSTSSYVISKRKLITNTNRLKSPPPKRNKKDNNIKLESKFATLFGSPIQHSELPLTISKSTSQKLSSSDKAQVKIKSSPHHKEDKKDKDKERDKEKRKIKQLSIEEGKNSISSFAISNQKLITNTNRLQSQPPKTDKYTNSFKSLEHEILMLEANMKKYYDFLKNS